MNICPDECPSTMGGSCACGNSVLPWVKIGDYSIHQDGGVFAVTGGDLATSETIHFSNKWTAYSWVNLQHNCATLVSQGVSTMLDLMIEEGEF